MPQSAAAARANVASVTSPQKQIQQQQQLCQAAGAAGAAATSTTSTSSAIDTISTTAANAFALAAPAYTPLRALVDLSVPYLFRRAQQTFFSKCLIEFKLCYYVSTGFRFRL